MAHATLRVPPPRMTGALALERMVGLAMVTSLHIAGGVMLYDYQMMPAAAQDATVFVHFIQPQAEIEPPPPPPPPSQPRPKPPREKPADPPPTLLAAQVPVQLPTDFAVPPPSPVVQEAPAETREAAVETGPSEDAPVAPPPPPEPLMLNTDLAVGCPHRFAPEYPTGSRRFGESGKLVLRVELDATGHIAAVKVKESTGFRRLDEAGIAAVRQWQCNPPMREGKAVAAVALQPFNFVLEGRR